MNRRAWLRPAYLVAHAACFLTFAYLLFTQRDDLLPRRAARQQTRYIPSAYDWSKHRHKYPVPPSEMAQLPTGAPLPLPPIQHNFRPVNSKQPDNIRLLRRDQVKAAFQKTWASYEKFASGADELLPLSAKAATGFNGWGATLIDSLDTLWIMGMDAEFARAVDFVASLDWDHTTGPDCNLFETNIRYLGGLLAAYELSHESTLLKKAVELGDMLYAAFDNPPRIPLGQFKWSDLKSSNVAPFPIQSIAGIGTFGMEFTRLSQWTGDTKYYDAIDRIYRLFDQAQDSTAVPGLWPTHVDATANFAAKSNEFHLGGSSDSAYEYLIKMYILLDGQETMYATMYRKAIDAAKRHLLYRPMLPKNDDVLLPGVAFANDGREGLTLVAKTEHLACFAGGMFALGSRILENDDDFEKGVKLTRGCAALYTLTPSGIMPETCELIRFENPNACPWNETLAQESSTDQVVPQGFHTISAPYYDLRPEALESLFILYRTTGDESLRDTAWRIWESIRAACETRYGFAHVEDVTTESPAHLDRMDSFFLAETLKYLYLLFEEPSVISLDEFVFTTEAHPLRRPLNGVMKQ